MSKSSERREQARISYFSGGRLVEECVYALDPSSDNDIEWFNHRISMDQHDMLTMRNALAHDEVRANWSVAGVNVHF